MSSLKYSRSKITLIITVFFILSSISVKYVSSSIFNTGNNKVAVIIAFLLSLIGSAVFLTVGIKALITGKFKNYLIAFYHPGLASREPDGSLPEYSGIIAYGMGTIFVIVGLIFLSLLVIALFPILFR